MYINTYFKAKYIILIYSPLPSASQKPQSPHIKVLLKEL